MFVLLRFIYFHVYDFFMFLAKYIFSINIICISSIILLLYFENILILEHVRLCAHKISLNFESLCVQKKILLVFSRKYSLIVFDVISFQLVKTQKLLLSCSIQKQFPDKMFVVHRQIFGCMSGSSCLCCSGLHNSSEVNKTVQRVPC